MDLLIKYVIDECLIDDVIFVDNLVDDIYVNEQANKLLSSMIKIGPTHFLFAYPSLIFINESLIDYTSVIYRVSPMN